MTKQNIIWLIENKLEKGNFFYTLYLSKLGILHMPSTPTTLPDIQTIVKLFFRANVSHYNYLLCHKEIDSVIRMVKCLVTKPSK